MKSQDLKEFSAYVAVLLYVFSYVAFIEKLDFYSNAFLGLATSVLSIWITLAVIEKALKDDRAEKQLAIKGITLKSLLYNIVAIVYHAPMAVGGGIKYLDSKLLNEYSEEIRNGALEPKEHVVVSIFGLADMIGRGQKDRQQFLFDLSKKQDSETALQEERRFDAFTNTYYYQDISFRINRIKESLIPRMLELIDDRELELALLKFEEISDRYSEHMRLQLQNKDYPIHSERLVELLKSLAVVYALSIKKM